MALHVGSESGNSSTVVRLFSRRKKHEAVSASQGYRRNERPAHMLDRNAIEEYFCYVQSDAARELGISITSLKQVCRKLGIQRWPGPIRRHRSQKDETSSRSPQTLNAPLVPVESVLPNTSQGNVTWIVTSEPYTRCSGSETHREGTLADTSPQSDQGTQSPCGGIDQNLSCEVNTPAYDEQSEMAAAICRTDCYADAVLERDERSNDLGWLMTVYHSGVGLQ